MSYQPPPPGPPPPPPPPGGSYQQPPGYYPPPPNSGKSVAILVLGIVGIVMLCGPGLITSIVALALAPGAKREIAQSQGRVGGSTFVKVGVILSWIAIGLFIAGVVLYVLLLIVLAVTSSSVDQSSNSINSAMVWLGR